MAEETHTTLYIRLEIELHQQLKDIAEREQRTIAVVARNMIAKGLEASRG